MNLHEKIDLKLQSANPVTASHKRCILRRFFKDVGEKETYDEYDALGFLNSCKQHYSPSSCVQIHNVLRWFYRHILGQNLGDGASRPEIDKDIRAPVLECEEVASLIQAARQLNDPLAKTLVAMATTYGARRKEMRLEKEDIDLKHSRIYIRSAKRGFRRWMHVPDCLLPILADFLVQYRRPGLSVLSAYFWYLAERAALQLDTDRRIGWHAVRHRIIAELTQLGFSDYQLVTYFRWRHSASSLSILYRYRSMVSNDEIINTVDKPILKVHPFLKYWGNH